MERAEKLYEATMLLLEVCKEMQIETRKFFKDDQLVGFAKEFCTIKLGCSRRSGHTTLINLLLERMFPKSLVLFPNSGMLENYKTHYDKGNNQSIFATERTGSDKWRGITDLDAVIIDAASFVPKKRMNKIYKALSEKKRFEKDFYFILLE